jgi:hypothetical protein
MSAAVEHSKAPRGSAVAVVAAVAVGALFLVSLALWAHYGPAVFMEMLIAGIAACF